MASHEETEVSSEISQPKIKQEPICETEIGLEDVNALSGKVLDYQFLVIPKEEPVEIKTELEETLVLTGEIIDPFDEKWESLSKNVPEEKYLPRDRYFCEECNRSFPFKRHDVHMEYVKILDKINPKMPDNRKYLCKECNIMFEIYQEAIKHLIVHDRTTFECSYCIFVGKELSELKYHLKDAHGDSITCKSNTIFRCDQCDFTSNHAKTVRNHVDAAHTKVLVKCKHCDEYWPDKDHTLHEKIKHITRREITSENPYSCLECNLKFDVVDKIYEHLKIHDDIGFYCIYCTFNTEERSELEDHKQSQHLDEINQNGKTKEISVDEHACTICNRLWPDKSHDTHLRMLQLMKKGVSEEQPYKCNGCLKDITDINKVYYHLRLACKKLHCNQCSYMTMYVSHMDRHKFRVHPKPHQVKKYKHFCDVCDYKTDSIKNLRYHKTIHLDESEKVYFHCDACNFKTTNLKYLKRHKSRQHESSKNKEIISCTECSFTTTDIIHLQRHRKRTHSNVLYDCPNCTYQARNKNYLKKHLVSQHLTSKENKQKSVYVCEQCGVNYRFKTSLNIHMIKVHNIHSVGTKKLKCPSCKYETYIKSYLLSHIRNKHERTDDKRLYCANCDYSTFLKLNLIQHMVKHMDPSKMQMHKCTLCSFTTKRPHTLRHHVKTHGLAQ